MTMDPTSDPSIAHHAQERVEAALGNAYSATLYLDEADGCLAYAAGVLRNIEVSHPFVDGNKKTGWILCVRALEINGYTLEMMPVEVVDLCVQTLTERLEIDDIADRLAPCLRIK